MRSTQQSEPQSERSHRPAVQTAAATEEAVASAGVASAEERDVSAAYPAPTLTANGFSTAAATVEKVAHRRALLAANAADDRPAGGGIDGGDLCRALLAPGLAGCVAGRRDAPVERGR